MATPDVELVLYWGSGTERAESGRVRGQIYAMRLMPHKGWGEDEGPPRFVHLVLQAPTLSALARWGVHEEETSRIDGADVRWSTKTPRRVNIAQLPAFIRRQLEAAALDGSVPRVRLEQISGAIVDEMAAARARILAGDTRGIVRSKSRGNAVPEED